MSVWGQYGIPSLCAGQRPVDTVFTMCFQRFPAGIPRNIGAKVRPGHVKKTDQGGLAGSGLPGLFRRVLT